MRRQLDRMDQDLLIKGYSLSTRKVYMACVKAFADHYPDTPPGKLTLEDIRRYQLHLTRARGVSWCYFNQAVAALRFFCGVTLNKDWDIQRIRYQKREHRLPEILSQEEVSAILAATSSLRDRAILMALYGGGLRLGEVRFLRIGDIDSKRMVIRVVQGKGSKDRYVRLPDALLLELRAYWRVHRPGGPLLFPGEDHSGALSGSTIQHIVKNAARRAGITKRTTPHSLRHAYATHHLEQGTNLREIQLLLGHRSLNSTAVYTHVARSAVAASSSPLDGLAIQKGQVPKHQ